MPNRELPPSGYSTAAESCETECYLSRKWDKQFPGWRNPQRVADCLRLAVDRLKRDNDEAEGER